MKSNFKATKQNVTVAAGVMSSLLALAAGSAYADPLDSFVSCVNSLPAASRNVAGAAATCVPAGAHVTVTMSGESAQPACTLRDGTRLPRVIFSIPGAAGSLGGNLDFRPSFSLCTQGGTINHIEVGQDVNKSTRTDDADLRNFPYLQKMADFDVSPSNTPWAFTQFGAVPNVATAVLDAKTPANSKGCAECHDRKGTVNVSAAVPPGIANLFLPIPAAVADGTLFTNDPATAGFGSLNANPFPAICAGIQNSTSLNTAKPAGVKTLAINLCNALRSAAGL